MRELGLKQAEVGKKKENKEITRRGEMPTC
jgi:hypothetical protein